ncbi:DUF3090 domain-containing protein [soil metagenome]
MPTIVHEFAWPDRVVVGTLGRPGSRTFYLQVRSRAQIVSVALEKEQSALLAEMIDEILDELMAGEGDPFSIPALTPMELIDNDPLEQPVEERFRTGTMSLGWDPSTAQIVIEIYPSAETDDNGRDPVEADPPEMLLVRASVGTARAFARRTREVVGAGRPICPLCGTPIDAGGHVCTLPGELR